jgi:hypothetical protein
MPNQTRLMDAYPVLRYKFPEGRARFDQRPNEIFSSGTFARSNSVHSSDEMRISSLTERVSTVRRLRSYLFRGIRSAFLQVRILGRIPL